MPRFTTPRLSGGRLASSRLALPGAVLLALVITFIVAWATRPGPAQVVVPGGQAVSVTSVTRSCPPAAPGGATSQVTMIAVPSTGSATTAGQASRPSTGTATFSPVSAASSAGKFAVAGKSSAAGQSSAAGRSSATSKPATAGKPAATGAKEGRPVTVSAPGTVATVTATGGGSAVAATGQMAEGFEAEQADSTGTGLVSCTHPGSDMWFVGTGQSAGAAQTWLYLVNTGSVTASANVTILTDTGEQSGLSSAITVLPDQSVKENIAPLVSGSQALGLHVQANTGQVAASVWEGGSSGRGAWLPQAAAPSTSLVIPGLTVASSAAKLFVVVPGATDAQLRVVAYTPAGAVNQFPGNLVDASAGAATPITLNSLGASATGLRLTSNVPVVAGVLVPGSGIGSFTTGASPVTEQGVVAGNPASRGVTVGLLLTAPAAAGQASVSVISADGTITKPAADQSVTVAAGHTLALAVPRPGGSSKQPFAIVVTPAARSGPLYAVRVVTSGTGGLSAPTVSLLPVQSARTSIILAPASDSYQAVLP